MTPQDYYFMPCNEYKTFYFVTKEYWEQNESIDDSNDRELRDLLPKAEGIAWSEDVESAYSPFYEKSLTRVKKSDAIKMLKDAGFTQIENPWE